MSPAPLRCSPRPWTPVPRHRLHAPRRINTPVSCGTRTPRSPRNPATRPRAPPLATSSTPRKPCWTPQTACTARRRWCERTSSRSLPASSADSGPTRCTVPAGRNWSNSGHRGPGGEGAAPNSLVSSHRIRATSLTPASPSVARWTRLPVASSSFRLHRHQHRPWPGSRCRTLFRSRGRFLQLASVEVAYLTSALRSYPLPSRPGRPREG